MLPPPEDEMQFSTMQVSKKLNLLSFTRLSKAERRASIDTALRYAAVFSPDEGVLFETRDTAASPSRDYYQLKVGKNEVALVRWCISNALSHPNTAPTQEAFTFEEFIHETKFHEKIIKIFDQDTLDHAERIVLGEWDFLHRIPDKVFKNIFLMLDLKDQIALSLTSKQLQEMCSADSLWEILYQRYSSQPASSDDVKVVRKIGWKKVFFINNKDLVLSTLRSGKRKTSTTSVRLKQSKDKKVAPGTKKQSATKISSRTSSSSVKRYY